MIYSIYIGTIGSDPGEEDPGKLICLYGVDGSRHFLKELLPFPDPVAQN